MRHWGRKLSCVVAQSVHALVGRDRHMPAGKDMSDRVQNHVQKWKIRLEAATESQCRVLETSSAERHDTAYLRQYLVVADSLTGFAQ